MVSKKGLFFIWFLFAPLFLFAGDYFVENQPRVLEKARGLPNCGILKQKENGFLYLEITHDFIFQVLPLIQSDFFIFPPPHETHITVMTEQEAQNRQIKELGNCYYFEVQELRAIFVGEKKLWILAIRAPALECLRESYALLPKINGHDFHITIGVQAPKMNPILLQKN